MTPRVLGLDLGGSRSKWVLVQGDLTLGTGEAPPLTAALLPTDAGQQALAALAAALPAVPDVVQAGLPGFSAGRADAGHLRTQLTQALRVPGDRLRLLSDIELAYRAHFHPGEGVLLYAGTGSFACHVTRAGQLLRAGGHGFHIDDDGGGYAIGRAALRWLTRQIDLGREPSGALARAVREVTGSLDWEVLRGYAYGTPGAGAVAALAPAVGRAAGQADPVALGILHEAADALLDLAGVLVDRVGRPLPVVATGGALRVSEVLPGRLRVGQRVVRVEHLDHALAAARLVIQEP